MSKLRSGEAYDIGNLVTAVSTSVLPIKTKTQETNAIGSRQFISPFGGHLVGQAGTLPVDINS
jgi:hypothetical protein